jgi:hypothetical protein
MKKFMLPSQCWISANCAARRDETVRVTAPSRVAYALGCAGVSDRRRSERRETIEKSHADDAASVYVVIEPHMRNGLSAE